MALENGDLDPTATLLAGFEDGGDNNLNDWAKLAGLGKDGADWLEQQLAEEPKQGRTSGETDSSVEKRTSGVAETEAGQSVTSATSGVSGKKGGKKGGKSPFRVFVTKIPENLTHDDLTSYFAQFGGIDDLFVPLRNPGVKGDRSHKNIAFVSFANETVYNEVLSRREYEVKQGVFVVVDKAMSLDEGKTGSSNERSKGGSGKWGGKDKGYGGKKGWGKEGNDGWGSSGKGGDWGSSGKGKGGGNWWDAGSGTGAWGSGAGSQNWWDVGTGGKGSGNASSSSPYDWWAGLAAQAGWW